MRNWKQLIPYLAGAALAIAAVGILKTPKVSAAIRATFVEIVIPSHPFNDSMELTSGAQSVGPDTGTLGVTNLVITNFNNTRQQIFFFAPVFANGGCGGSGANIIGGGGPRMYVEVPANETIVVPYPSPLTYAGVAGHTCIAAQNSSGGFVDVNVTGFVN